MTARMNRRIYGVLSKRLDDVAFDLVRDDRDPRGMRWQLGALLRAVTGAMLGGAKSLAEAEALSERMSTPIRKLLGIGRRVPDTTLRDALTSDRERGQVVTRRLYLGSATATPDGWESLRTVLRIETEITDRAGNLVHRDDRYLVSSMPECRLTKAHWLLLVRRRWGVETSHQILDTVFHEDDHPWIEAHPRAAFVVSILRRIAYTLLSLFRSVTQRSLARRSVPWADLVNDVLFALVTTTREHIAQLRRPPTPLVR